MTLAKRGVESPRTILPHTAIPNYNPSHTHWSLTRFVEASPSAQTVMHRRRHSAVGSQHCFSIALAGT